MTIIKSFLCSGISNDLTGNEDILSKNLLLLKGKKIEEVSPEVEQILAKEISKEEQEYYKNVYNSPENVFQVPTNEIQSEE